MTVQAEKESKYWWQYLSWMEVVERAKQCDIAILPLGSIEQHGPHLPTSHDTLQLFPMLEGVAARTGAMLLPCPWYGAHPSYHFYFPGTIPLQNDTMRAVIKDVIRGASYAGFNKFLLVYGHGQSWVANYAVQDLGLEGFFVISIMFQNMLKGIHDTIFEMPFWHADESETSIALYTHPQYVDMSKAGKETATVMVDPKYYANPSEAAVDKVARFDEGTFSVPEHKSLKLGIIGDATLATEEKGRRYIKAAVERLTEFVEHIKSRWPVGEKPPVQ